MTAYRYPDASNDDPAAPAGTDVETPTGPDLCPNPVGETAADERSGSTLQTAQPSDVCAGSAPAASPRSRTVRVRR